MSRIISTFMGTLIKPFGALQKLKEEGLEAPIGFYLIYSAVLVTISGLINTVFTLVNPPLQVAAAGIGKGILIGMSLLNIPFFWVGIFVSAFLYWGVTVGFFRGSFAEYKATYRLMAITTTFAPIIALLSAIPGLVGVIIVIICVLAVMAYVIYGLIQILGAKPLQTIIIVVGYLLVMVLFVTLAVVVANQQARGPGFGAPAGEIDADFEAEMERLLQEAGQDQEAENTN